LIFCMSGPQLASIAPTVRATSSLAIVFILTHLLVLPDLKAVPVV
jgi:hypothetical protein